MNWDDALTRAVLDDDELAVGVAVGLVMSRSDVGQDEAEDLLAAAADRVGRGLVDVARSYVETGYV